MSFQVSDRHVGYILNKSNYATPELFAIYMQNAASQLSKWKCLWMFKDWVMLKVKGLRMLSRRNTWKSFKCDRVQFLGYKFEQKSHTAYAFAENSTDNQIRLNEMVVLDMWQPEMCFDRLEKQP